MLIVCILASWAVAALLLVLIFDAAWADALYFPVLLLALTGLLGVARPPVGLPLVVREQGLLLTGRDGREIALDWADLVQVRVVGRFPALLVVEVTEPGSVRAGVGRWEWERVSRGSFTRSTVGVPLLGVTPGVRRLRRELALRQGTVGESDEG
jgi:hypothetical protein